MPKTKSERFWIVTFYVGLGLLGYVAMFGASIWLHRWSHNPFASLLLELPFGYFVWRVVLRPCHRRMERKLAGPHEERPLLKAWLMPMPNGPALDIRRYACGCCQVFRDGQELSPRLPTPVAEHWLMGFLHGRMTVAGLPELKEADS